MRLRINCFTLEDFEMQADIMIKKFEKGYQKKNFVKLIKKDRNAGMYSSTNSTNQLSIL